jgi:hypothetical protein
MTPRVSHFLSKVPANGWLYQRPPTILPAFPDMLSFTFVAAIPLDEGASQNKSVSAISKRSEFAAVASAEVLSLKPKSK